MSDVHYNVHMDIKETLSVSEARKRIFELVNEVQKPDTYYTLTENGKPKAVLLSIEEFESLVETIEVMQESPGLAKEIEEVERDIRTGAYKTYPILEEVLAEEGFVVADRAQKNQSYGIPSTNKTKRKQRTRKISRQR